MDRPGSQVETEIVAVEGSDSTRRRDRLATEEPLEIRLRAGGRRATVATTMRTPGHDFELAAGFLHAEGVLDGPDDLSGMAYCVDRDLDEAQRFNVVNVDLRSATLPDLGPLERYGTITSACGVCGRATLDDLATRARPLETPEPVDPDVIRSLPNRLIEAQGLFAATGGLHAAGVFAPDGEPLVVREDVGRHNALDKAVGWALLQGRLPLTGTIALVSGRASYEIMQKALVAGIPAVCSVSAPSSLAVAIAREFRMLLVGFLRDERYNVYAGADRLMDPGDALVRND